MTVNNIEFTSKQINYIKNLAAILIGDGENEEYTRGICELIADIDGINDLEHYIRSEQIKSELINSKNQSMF